MSQITKQTVLMALDCLIDYALLLLITMLVWGLLDDSGIIDLDVFIESTVGAWVLFISVAVAPAILAVVLTQIKFTKGGKDAQPKE